MPPTGHDLLELALRDQLIAALRAIRVPVSTADLARQMPRHLHLHHGGWQTPPLCTDGHALIGYNPYVDLVECRGPHEHLLSMQTMPARIYPMLQQLRREGRCQRVGRVTYGPLTRWVWVPAALAPAARQDEVDIEDRFAELVARMNDAGDGRS